MIPEMHYKIFCYRILVGTCCKIITSIKIIDIFSRLTNIEHGLNILALTYRST